MTTTPTEQAERVYPLPPIHRDPRFTLSLLVDVCTVLERHGYQRPTNGLDLVDLQNALHGFVYGKPECSGVCS